MRKRTKAREYALQVLYQLDIRRADCQQILHEFWQEHQPSAEVRGFATKLAEGTVKCLGDIDGFITSHADNWDLKRMAVVDRNILRLGVFELLYMDDAPPAVCINEAIELAKRFGDAESAKFINGILDAIYKAHGRTPAPPAAFPTSADPPTR